MTDSPRDKAGDGDEPSDLPTTRTPPPEDPATVRGRHRRIGPYHLLQKIGEGGMGEVWLAEQTEPVRRQVALKIIKQGMDTKQIVARFEAERQALALMDHPCIAKVYDAGATPRGRPYFVMEHVKGVPITSYCDRHRLTNRERLDLFMQVCEGVQHAHQKAVIHRDLKPGNVLVAVRDDKPAPKIIDFGVAKATAQKLTEKTFHTQIGVMIGTPAYMSPEQAEMTGEDIDTRTDVYALGVMLYELLVGALPFDPGDLQRAGFEAMVRRIRDDEPPKPSTRLMTLGEHSTESAKRRRTDLPALRRELAGDLDRITMKALEKDRTRRYGSPHDLSADLKRYLTDQPVLASSPSAAYRAKKFVRRHRAGVGVAAAAIAALAGFAIFMTIERQRADREAETARQVSQFLESLFYVPRAVREATISARELVDRGALRIESELADRPLVRAHLMNVIGRVYVSLGEYDKAEPLLEGSLETRSRLLPAEDLELADSLHSLGMLRRTDGKLDEAQSLFERALAIRERRLGPGDPKVAETLRYLAVTLAETSKPEAARAPYERALSIREAALGPRDPLVAESLSDLAVFFQDMGEYPRARELYERALSIQEATLGPDHIDVGLTLANIGKLMAMSGKPDEGRPFLERSLAIYEAVFGPDHPQVANVLKNLGILSSMLGDLDAARAQWERAERIYVDAHGPEHIAVGTMMIHRGILAMQEDRPEEARDHLLRAVAIHEKALGKDHPRLYPPLTNLAFALTRLGRSDEAIPHLERAIAISEAALGPDHPSTFSALLNLATAQYRIGRSEEAATVFERAASLLEKHFGNENVELANAWLGLARIAADDGDTDRARDLYARASELRERKLPPEHPSLISIRDEYAEFLRGLGEEPAAGM